MNCWNVLARARDIPQPFYDLTLALQGRASDARHGSIWEALPALDFLLNGLDIKSKEYRTELTEASRPTKRQPIRKRRKKKSLTNPATTDVCNAHLYFHYCQLWGYL